MGSGVAGALLRNGGQEIEEEAVRKGPVACGEAVVTGAGRLRAKWVIHAVVMGQDLRTNVSTITLATKSSLKRADEVGAKTIAFPALGTGVGGFPLEECARLMLAAIHEHAASKTSLEKATFVLYGSRSFQTFKDELEKASI